jgi:hypothetical protein
MKEHKEKEKTEDGESNGDGVWGLGIPFRLSLHDDLIIEFRTRCKEFENCVQDYVR